MPLQIFISIFAGALIAPSLAPFSWSFLAFLPPALLYLLTIDKTPKAAAKLGWFFGIGFFGSGISWVYVSIAEHSATPLPAAIALTLSFVAALAILFALQSFIWRRFFSRSFHALSFIGIWLLFEWLRSWFLTGFPWLYLGYATLDTPLQTYLPIGGVWLGSLIILSISIMLASALKLRQPLRAVFAAIPLALTTQLPEQWTETTDNSLKVTIIQADIPQALKWKPAFRQEILLRYMTLSEQGKDSDMILWSETAIPALLHTAMPDLVNFLDQLERRDITLVSGLPTTEPDSDRPSGYRIYNSIGLLTVGNGLYHKQRLVPFGEYLPLEDYIRGTLDFFNLPMSSFSLPRNTQPLLEVKGIKISPAICYEIAYPELVRESSLAADLLLTVSNDTWFGHSIAPAQHMQIARARALENGRWLIRGTNNGITALVDSQGRVVQQLRQFSQGALSGNVQIMQGHTPYQQYGQHPWLILSALLMLLGLLPASQKRERALFR